ncbi:MAG: hypothetical protein KBC78_03010 [Candidatus Pacebacteria bacterium]|nr:hypothetical protein [Candidatus Paceibacterota bacterium]
MTEKERELMTQTKIDSEKTFDRGLLALTAGEIVLSVTVVTDLERISDKCILLSAWLFLLLSIISQMVSHIASAKAIDKTIYYHDNKLCPIFPNEDNEQIEFLNKLSLLLFIIGSCLFLYFVINNV